MALFSRRLRQTSAANTQVSVQALVEHVIYMQDTLERRNTELTGQLTELQKQRTRMQQDLQALQDRVKQLEGAE